MSTYNLADLFESIVDHFGDDEALVAKKSYSYNELDRSANRVAHYFIDQGLGAKDHIGIFAYNRAEWIICMLAAFKIRAVPININYRYTAKELLYICENADLKALIYEEQLSKPVATVSTQYPALHSMIYLPDKDSDHEPLKNATSWDLLMQSTHTERNFAPRSSDDLYVLYTGGTTGYPKGVMWRSEDLLFGALQGANPGGAPIESPESIAQVARAGMRMRSLLCAPLMHGGGMWASLISLLSAGSIVIYCERVFNAAQILKLAQDERASSLILIGDAMALPIVEELESRKYNLSSLLSIGSGGTMLSAQIKDRLRACLPDMMVFDSFGASETGSMGFVDDHSSKKSLGACFRMGPHVAVLDKQYMPIKPGSEEIGFVARKGYIPLGYYKDKARTNKTIRTDSNGKRWVVLEDNARVLADGTVELLGRDSVCINSGGEKIFAEEVESAIKTHPQIIDAVVVPTPHKRFGQQVTALVSLYSKGSLSLETLQKHLADHIASYKHPKVLFEVDKPPRTPVGKPDYPAANALAQKLIAQR